MARVRRSVPALRQQLAALLVLALLLSQALGSMHRVAHADGPYTRVHEHAGHLHEHAGPTAEQTAQALTTGLFDAHHDEADCRAFDQLTHCEAAPTGASATTETPPDTPPALPAEALNVAAGPADCRARGPPPA